MRPVVPSSSSLAPLRIASSAPATPITAGMPREWARMALWEVRVPSSLTRPTTCSRSSCTVSPGESSRATMTTFEPRSLPHQSGPAWPVSRCSTRRWVAVRSVRRSRSTWLPAPAHISRASSALNSKAVSALSRLFRMRNSTSPRKSGSCTMRICASKMPDSSGPARSSTRALSSSSSSTTSCTASWSRATSASTSPWVMERSGTSGKSNRTTTAGPRATPGETPMPRRRRVLTSRRSPGRPAPRSRPPPPTRRRRRPGSPGRTRTRQRAS